MFGLLHNLVLKDTTHNDSTKASHKCFVYWHEYEDNFVIGQNEACVRNDSVNFCP